jgi:hypothetical protein
MATNLRDLSCARFAFEGFGAPGVEPLRGGGSERRWRLNGG